MSQGQKSFERPKVRFSQPSEDSSTNSEILEKPINSTSNKPRIRSIVTLENPFEIIYKNGDLPSTSKGIYVDTDTQYSSNPKTHSSDVNSQRPTSSNQHNADSKTSSGISNLHKSSSTTNNLQNKSQKDEPCSIILNGEKEPKPLPSASNSKNSQTSLPSDPSKNTAQIKTGAIPKPGRTSASKIGSRHITQKTVPLAVKKMVKKNNENVSSAKNSVSKNTLSKINIRQKEKTPAKGAAICSTTNRNATTAKTVPCGLKISKPGTKVWKTRSKSSPVKKTILRDITGHPTNVYVAPGVARYYPQPFKFCPDKERPHIRPDIVSGEKLSRPEYNSIMCTIDQLKKVQSEKFVTDVEHLPLVYRNLVNEKVSAALDFPPDEKIYKNLVDLSVNENQLPARVTRSKDPEPRNRDIVPKLSDFFTPTYSEEYCTAVHIRSNSPEIFTNWSAFAISDKIFGWKHDMDQCY